MSVSHSNARSIALRAVLSLMSSGLAGCVSTPTVESPAPDRHGAVGASLVQPASDSRRIALASHQRFVYPTLDPPAALPAYPIALLPHRLAPVEICIDVVVGEDGRVAAVAPREDAACASPAAAQVEAFLMPTLEAVRTWTYWPALLCTAPATFTGRDPCTADDVVETPTAVRLSYAIRFSQLEGRPMVERGG